MIIKKAKITKFTSSNLRNANRNFHIVISSPALAYFLPSLFLSTINTPNIPFKNYNFLKPKNFLYKKILKEKKWLFLLNSDSLYSSLFFVFPSESKPKGSVAPLESPVTQNKEKEMSVLRFTCQFAVLSLILFA